MKETIKHIGFLSLLILSSLVAYAQTPEANFKGQGNGDEVKLMWFPKVWSTNLDGYNVKRKKEGGVWEKLNSNVIRPSTGSEMLTNVTNDRGLAAALRLTQDSLKSVSKIPDLGAEQMKQEYLLDATAIKFLAFGLTIDYNYALVQGLGYYDRNIPTGDAYTYGLFAVINGQEQAEPLDTYQWQHGSKPTIQIDSDIEVTKLRKKKGLSVTWNIQTKQTQEQDVKGFYIYQQDTLGNIKKLTEMPVRPNMLDEIAQIFHIDNKYDVSQRTTFYLLPVDIFDTRGERIEVEYTSEKFPILEAPVLEVDDIDDSTNDIQIKWNFNPLNERLVQKFEVVRRRNVNDPKEPLENIGISKRVFADKTIEETGFYFYTIAATTIDGQQLFSNEIVVHKTIVNLPSSPQNLRGTVVKQGGKSYVSLTWQGNDLDSGYYLFSDALKGGLSKKVSIGLITEIPYKYEIAAIYGKRYLFAVSAINADFSEGPLSDTIEVFVPSKTLPKVNIWPIAKANNQVTLNWKYLDSIQDLEGFRLYQNGELILDETNLDSNIRQWISDPLESGKYYYEIEAVSKFGVISRLSEKRNFNIQGQ